jgi:CBS domain-containing protein
MLADEGIVPVSKIGTSGLPIRRPLNGETRQHTYGLDAADAKAVVTARDLMRACAATLRPQDSIERAAALMTRTQTGSLPVVDAAGRLIGIITDRDITVKLVALGASIPHAQVSDCMTGEAFACSPDSSIESCVSAMAWHQVTRLPIVDDEHRILGMISRSDLACYICEEPEKADHGSMVDILWALAF